MPPIAHKLTRCHSRDAESAEGEQENSIHVSNARRTCGPIYSGRGCRVNRRTGAPRCAARHSRQFVRIVSTGGEKKKGPRRSVGGVSAPRTALQRHLRSFNSLDRPRAAGDRAETSTQPQGSIMDWSRALRRSYAPSVFQVCSKTLPDPLLLLVVMMLVMLEPSTARLLQTECKRAVFVSMSAWTVPACLPHRLLEALQ